MASGRKYNALQKEKLKTSLAKNNMNVRETAKDTGYPEATVEKYRREFKKDPAFQQFLTNYNNAYVEKGKEIAYKFLKIIGDKLDDIDKDPEIKAVTKLNELTTGLGTITDKIQLIQNQPTTIVGGEIQVKKFEDL